MQSFKKRFISELRKFQDCLNLAHCIKLNLVFLQGETYSLHIIANQIALSSVGSANVFVCDRKIAKLLQKHPLPFLGLFYPSRQFHIEFQAFLHKIEKYKTEEEIANLSSSFGIRWSHCRFFF